MHARSRTALSLALVLGAAAARPAHAQEAATAPATTEVTSAVAAAPAAPVASTPAAGPTTEAATVGVRHRADAPATNVAARRGGSAPGVPLMIVGGAAILVGAVIGDSAGGVIAVGGAVALLIGLYEYLQ